MKKLVKIFGIYIFIISNILAFDINTTIFDQKIDDGNGYKEIVFKNKSIENIRYKVKVLKSDEKNKDMSKWVEVSPIVLNAQPLSEKVLKIFAKAPKGIKDDEYSFMLKIEPIIIPTISKAKEGGIKGSSSLAFVPIIKMFGYTGDPNFQENIDLENINLKKVDKEYILTGTLINNSYAGKNIGFNFIGDNDFIVDGKWIGRLRPNFKEEISIKVLDKFKEISVYDAESNKEIKRISI